MTNNKIDGKFMAIIVGVVCCVAPWFGCVTFETKFIITILGFILIYLGAK